MNDFFDPKEQAKLKEGAEKAMLANHQESVKKERAKRSMQNSETKKQIRSITEFINKKLWAKILLFFSAKSPPLKMIHFLPKFR